MVNRSILAFVSLLIVEVFFPGQVKAQTALVDPRTTEYVCVLSRTVKQAGVVLVLPCEAADVRQDSLTDADYAIFEKMQAARILFGLVKSRPGSEAEARTTRSDFLKYAKALCEEHPQIALLPLDWKAEQARLSEMTAEAGSFALKPCGTL
jgi:hypothetical protein